MKIKILLLVFSLFLLINSCNNDVIEEMDITEVQKSNATQTNSNEAFLNQIFPSDYSAYTYVNIINSAYCFSCYPVFGLVADELKKTGFSSDNLVYVFPSMRKVMQTDFLTKNFNLHPEEAKVIFDDQLYNYLQDEYHLEGSSNMLCFNQNKEMVAKAEYDRANVSEVLSIVN